MLQPNTIKFLQQLAKNNNKDWFDKHRDEYAIAKQDFEELVAGVLHGLGASEPVFKDLQAKDCIFRIFRDVRFSKDKTPYKAHFSAGFSKGGKKTQGAGYYLHIEPGGKSMAGGGLWMPEAPMLKAIRQEIDYNFKEFKKIIDDKKFKKLFGNISGEQLKTVPKNYTADNPAIEYLKMKSFVAGNESITDTDLTGKTLTKKILESFNTMRPFIDFLNKGIS